MSFFPQVGYSGRPLGEDVHLTVLHSAWCTSGSAAIIHVVCAHVDANEAVDCQQDNVPLFVTKLEWLTFFSSGYLTYCIYSHINRPNFWLNFDDKALGVGLYAGRVTQPYFNSYRVTMARTISRPLSLHVCVGACAAGGGTEHRMLLLRQLTS